jgi:inorganic triphosphatase YgiF
VELKLAVPAPDLPKLERALRDLAPESSCSRSCLTTTYYDTADRALSRGGLSVRVREADGRFVQTVKANGAAGAGVLMRSEWEDEIAGATPDLRAPHRGCRLPDGIVGELQPMFVTAVTRTTMILEPSPALSIEAAIDEGTIRSIVGGAMAPISEVELELKHGDPGVLFDIALDLLAAAPLRIETRSKSECGYAAVAGEAAPAQPARAAPIALDPAIPSRPRCRSSAASALRTFCAARQPPLLATPRACIRCASRRAESARRSRPSRRRSPP